MSSANRTGPVHAAGVSPSQAPIETILKADLYGTALVLELFSNVIGQGGSGVVISSQSGHRLQALTAEQDLLLATTPTQDLLKLPMLRAGQVADTLHAYQRSKRGNSPRVMAEAVEPFALRSTVVASSSNSRSRHRTELPGAELQQTYWWPPQPVKVGMARDPQRLIAGLTVEVRPRPIPLVRARC